MIDFNCDGDKKHTKQTIGNNVYHWYKAILKRTQAGAINWADGLNHGGSACSTGWHCPTVAELKSLPDTQSPYLNTQLLDWFNGGEVVWSRTTGLGVVVGNGENEYDPSQFHYCVALKIVPVAPPPPPVHKPPRRKKKPLIRKVKKALKKAKKPKKKAAGKVKKVKKVKKVVKKTAGKVKRAPRKIKKGAGKKRKVARKK